MRLASFLMPWNDSGYKPNPEWEMLTIKNASIAKRTEKAILVKQGIVEEWLPSQYVKELYCGLKIPKWLADKKSFIVE